MKLVFGIIIGLAIAAIVVAMMCCFVVSGRQRDDEIRENRKDV